MPGHQRWRASASSPADAGDEPVSAALARLVVANPSLAPPPRAPSPLLSPGQVARAVLAALQRCDYPTPGAGAAAAFAFTLPADTGGAAPVSPGAGRAGRDWGRDGGERWLTQPEWEAAVLGAGSLAHLLIGANEACVAGPPALGADGRAAVPVSVVRVGPDDDGGSRKEHALALELTLVEAHGPWRGCYLVSGLTQR